MSSPLSHPSPVIGLEIHISQDIYGAMPDGQPVKIFTLTHPNGCRARVTEYGAILVSMETPDRAGNLADLTHGYDGLAGWLTNTAYFGASIGRFGNRIKGGKFTLDGLEYTLATNNFPQGIPCHLHGGLKGFDKVLWSGRITDENAVEFNYTSIDSEEGYPGTVTATITYTLTARNELVWQAKATTDAPTILNIVHHSYWNLSGNPESSIQDHVLTIHAEHYLPTDSGLIPTGEIAAVSGTPMDFTRATAIGERIDADFEALEIGGGYDHAWVLPSGGGMRIAARVEHPQSGRVMVVSTDQPAIQFYAGNSLDGKIIGKNAVAYGKRTALCLETEGFPDAPNHSTFPSAVIRPGETYTHTLIHQFSVTKDTFPITTQTTA